VITLGLWMAWACSGHGQDSAAGPTCCVSDHDELWAAARWDLVPVTPRSVVVGAGDTPRMVLRAAGNDDVYSLNADGESIQYLGPSWTWPEGDFCLDGLGTDTPEDCTRGVHFTPGRIALPESWAAACLDDVDDQILLVKPGGSAVGMVGTSRDSETWKSWNRPWARHLVARDTGDKFDQACASRGGDHVALSSADGVALLDTTDPAWQIGTRISLTGGLSQMSWLADQRWLVGAQRDGSVWAIDTQDTARATQLVPPGSASVLAVDADRGVLWVARGSEGRLLRLVKDEQGFHLAQSWSLCGRIHELAVDSRTGAIHALADCPDAPSGTELLVMDEQGLRAAQPLDEPAIALVPPGAMGQLAALVQAPDGSTAVRAWYVQDPQDERPPLSMFIVSTLEQPFTDANMACTASEDPADNFTAYVDQLRANIAPLRSTGLPVAFGVTWEFGTKARQCGLDGVLGELVDAGFTLGVMVHDKPCYSCTDGDVLGEVPASCSPTSRDYASPDSEGACWPSNPDYCAPDDQACWTAWTGQRALDVDTWIPGGAHFIFGADRHRLWGYEYIAHGYRIFPRADGSTGYDLSLFQGDWVYPQITDEEDPRAKDPAPWHPELLGHSWFPASSDDWEADSAFSNLLYLPGNSIALSRQDEAERSDLTLVQLTDQVSPLTTTQDDADSLFAAVLRPAAHRGDRPGTFSFHLADLTGYALVPTTGDDRTDQVVLLEDLRDRVNAAYGPEGLNVAKWQGPLEVRAEVEAWLAAHPTIAP